MQLTRRYIRTRHGCRRRTGHRVFKYTGNDGLLGIYKKYNWETGYIWFYNACVDLTQLATDPDDSRRRPTVAQALCIMGVNNAKCLPVQHQVTLIRHISTQDANSIETKCTLDGGAIPGHKDHLDTSASNSICFTHIMLRARTRPTPSSSQRSSRERRCSHSEIHSPQWHTGHQGTFEPTARKTSLRAVLSYIIPNHKVICTFLQSVLTPAQFDEAC